MADPKRPVLLTTVETEAEAALLMAALRDRGIEARATGQLTSGFRAEAPGGVRILVRQSDLDRAAEVLREFSPDQPDEE
jgi:type III secretory pathway lipoprotein EscJ